MDFCGAWCHKAAVRTKGDSAVLWKATSRFGNVRREGRKGTSREDDAVTPQRRRRPGRARGDAACSAIDEDEGTDGYRVFPEADDREGRVGHVPDDRRAGEHQGRRQALS